MFQGVFSAMLIHLKNGKLARDVMELTLTMSCDTIILHEEEQVITCMPSLLHYVDYNLSRHTCEM